jgi:peptide/nickel transport system substrate-binding protein
LQDVFNLNPFITAAGRDHHYLYQLYDALFAYTADNLSPQANLALSFEVPSETEIVLNLRPGVKFQDGSDLTAEVVAANIQNIIDPETKSVQAGLLRPIASVSATDEHTVRLELTSPSAAIIDFLSYNPGLMQAQAALDSDPSTNPIGAGPFALESRVQNDLTVLKRSEHYWDDQYPYLDSVSLKVLSDGTTRVNALRTGEVDLAIVIPPQFVGQLEQDENIRIVKGNTLVHHLFYVQSQNPPFNDVRLRQAVSLAIDRQDVIDRIFFGLGTPAQGTLTPVQPAFDPNASFVRHDPAEAKARLEASGHGSGFQFEVITQGVSPFKETVEAIQSQLAQVGIEMQITLLESAEFAARLVRGEIEALYSQWAGAADPDFTFTNRYLPEGGYNANRHDVPEVNALVKKARETYDADQRIELYREADRLANGVDEGQLALDIITAYPEEAFGMRKNVEGFEFFGDGKLRCKAIWLS